MVRLLIFICCAIFASRSLYPGGAGYGLRVGAYPLVEDDCYFSWFFDFFAAAT
jgi:hypothetical protein